MVKINGASADRRARICDICGAKLKVMRKPETCPNIERADHQGRPYAGGAKLPKDEPNAG